MNRQETIELLAKVDKHRKEMEAYANGAQIEYKSNDGQYEDADHPNWSLLCRYRVKQQPVIGPFTYDEASIHIGVQVTSTTKTITSMIGSADESGVIVSGNGRFTYQELLKEWKFRDGRPCGVRMER